MRVASPISATLSVVEKRDAEQRQREQDEIDGDPEELWNDHFISVTGTGLRRSLTGQMRSFARYLAIRVDIRCKKPVRHRLKGVGGEPVVGSHLFASALLTFV